MTAMAKEEIRSYILKEFLPGEDPRNLTDDLPLITTGILDSIATLKLVLHLEETYGITLEAHETDKENLDSVNKISSLVAKKVK